MIGDIGVGRAQPLGSQLKVKLLPNKGKVRVKKVKQVKCLGSFPLAASHHVYAAVINTHQWLDLSCWDGSSCQRHLFLFASYMKSSEHGSCKD